MSKPLKKSTQAAAEIGFSFGKLVPEKFQTPVLLISLLLLIVIFFSPLMFGDKTTSSGDLIQVKSLREYATKEREGFSLWNPHIFCGMPAVATSVSLRWFDLTAVAYSYISKIYATAFNDYNAIYTFSFVIMAFASFFLMKSFGASRGISFLVAVSTVFSTGILVLFYIGHITKLMSLAVFPFILMMLFRFQKEIKLRDVLFFAVGMHVLVLGAHVQIVFYLALTVLIYFLFFFIRSLVVKDRLLRNNLLKSLGITAAAGIIALLMSFDTYSQLWEYKPYSTRGTQSIVEQGAGSQQGNSYEYNTNWSFSPGEVLTFIVPSYYGFGKWKYKGELSQGQEVEVNTYFGQMPFVDTAMYMGVIIFFFALFTLFIRRKDPAVQFLGLLVVLYLLISFGKNFPVVFDLFYYYFPMFDNFRVPSMILHVLQIIFPILAGMGLMKIISARGEKEKQLVKVLKNATLIFAAFFILSLIFSGSLANWFSTRVNNYASSLGQQQEAQMFRALAGNMAAMFTGDLQIALALLTLAFGISYLYSESKINKDLLIAGLVFFVLFDLFRIGNRGASFVDSAQIDQMFREPDYVSIIKGEKNSEPFRILNLKQDGSLGSLRNNANFNVYFLLEDFYGYSAVKPRSYQDFMDTAGPINVTLWRMLGVKYVITDRPYNLSGFTAIHQSATTYILRNERALQRVYFVDSVTQKTPAEIIDAVKNDSFDPKKVAFVDKLDFQFDKADSNSTARIIKYNDETLTAEVVASGNNFLFFGTTFLPGWKAFIDGAPVAVYKTNHGFMGILVPKGNHKVEFVYQPSGFATGKYLSLMLNLILFGGIILTYAKDFLLKRKQAAVKND